jgi:hypothetical protein
LINIPANFRQQVWDLVDSGTWFFSGFFSPFRKRLPGWWWALDRPGDVRRSFRFAAVCAVTAALLIFGTGFAADAICVEVVHVWSHAARHSPDDAPPSSIIDIRYTSSYGLMGLLHERSRSQSRRDYPGDDRIPRAGTTFCRVLLDPSLKSFVPSGVAFLWVFFSWAGPAMVGLWTQIRKGLPDFARAPRTIMAAGNYEAHRLVYAGIVVACCMGADVVARVTVIPQVMRVNPAADVVLLMMDMALQVVIIAFSAASWVGPLRSDYTRQLVRSRFHAARIVVMYALLLPCVMTMIVAGSIHLLSLL